MSGNWPRPWPLAPSRSREPRWCSEGLRIYPLTRKNCRRASTPKRPWNCKRTFPFAPLRNLKTADGVLFGTPTRFGNMTSQLKALFDQMAELWAGGHGGQTRRDLRLHRHLPRRPGNHRLHHDGPPAAPGDDHRRRALFHPGMLHTEGRGGTPYAASAVAGGRNNLTPTPEDLEIAKALGAQVAQITGGCGVKEFYAVA